MDVTYGCGNCVRNTDLGVSRYVDVILDVVVVQARLSLHPLFLDREVASRGRLSGN